MSPSKVYKPQDNQAPVSSNTLQPESRLPIPQKTDPPKRKRLTPSAALIGVFLLAALCVVLVGGVGGGYFLVSSLLNAPEDTEVAASDSAQTVGSFTFSKVQAVAVNSDGKLYKDKEGVGLRVVPVNEEANAQVNLISNKPGKELENALKGNFSIESLAYGVSADPEKVSPPEGVLEFPAKSQDDRLAMIVDEKYIGIMPIKPVDGKLIVNPHVSAPDSGSETAATLSGEKPTKFFVVNPLKSQSPTDPSRMAFSGGGLHAPSDQTKSVVDCSGKIFGSYCYHNTAGSIYVYVDVKPLNLNPYLDLMNVCEQILTAYQKKGFNRALPTQNKPLVIIVGGKKAPEFQTISGKLKIPTDVIKDLTSDINKYAMSHELFHWVESKSYNMITGAINTEERWWLEMAAENATYLLDASYINQNLIKYGRTENNHQTGFQLEPFKWPKGEEARYLHAQNVLVGLCEGQPGCVFGESKFLVSINNAQYPFDNSFKKKYLDLADDVARYYIGMQPVNSSVNITLPDETKTGEAYGDYIQGLENSLAGGMIQTSGHDNVIIRSTDSVIYKIDIPAGNVAPLRVFSGTKKKGSDEIKMSGRPFYVRIPPGQTYFYRLGNGPAKEAVSLAEVIYGPIHSGYGFDSARFVAFAKSKPSKFEAFFELVDLSGDWMGEIKSIKNQSHTCSNTSQITNQKFDYFLTLLSAMGKFSRIADGNKKTSTRFEWKQDMTLPGWEGIKIKALAEAGSDSIHLTYSINIPKKTALLLGQQYALDISSPASEDTPIPWGFAVIPCAGMALLPVVKKDRRARVGLFILLVVCIMVSTSGCGLENIYGTVEGVYNFTRLEYADKNGTYPPTGDVYWRMPEGTGNIKISITYTSLNNLLDESQGKKEQTCKSSVEFDLSGYVQKDGLITPDNFPR